MTLTLHHPHQLEQIPMPCGCKLHSSGLILNICKVHQREVDPDRVMSLMLATNAKIAAVIERIDAADMIGMEPFTRR